MQIYQLMQAIRTIPLGAEVVIFDNRLWIKLDDCRYTELSTQPDVIARGKNVAVAQMPHVAAHND